MPAVVLAVRRVDAETGVSWPVRVPFVPPPPGKYPPGLSRSSTARQVRAAGCDYRDLPDEKGNAGYNLYLAHEDWLQVTSATRDRCRCPGFPMGRCERCESRAMADTHHPEYNKHGRLILYNEGPKDVGGLCCPCHEWQHPFKRLGGPSPDSLLIWAEEEEWCAVRWLMGRLGGDIRQTVQWQAACQRMEMRHRAGQLAGRPNCYYVGPRRIVVPCIPDWIYRDADEIARVRNFAPLQVGAVARAIGMVAKPGLRPDAVVVSGNRPAYGKWVIGPPPAKVAVERGSSGSVGKNRKKEGDMPDFGGRYRFVPKENPPDGLRYDRNLTPWEKGMLLSFFATFTEDAGTRRVSPELVRIIRKTEIANRSQDAVANRQMHQLSAALREGRYYAGNDAWCFDEYGRLCNGGNRSRVADASHGEVDEVPVLFRLGVPEAEIEIFDTNNRVRTTHDAAFFCKLEGITIPGISNPKNARRWAEAAVQQCLNGANHTFLYMDSQTKLRAVEHFRPQLVRLAQVPGVAKAKVAKAPVVGTFLRAMVSRPDKVGLILAGLQYLTDGDSPRAMEQKEGLKSLKVLRENILDEKRPKKSKTLAKEENASMFQVRMTARLLAAFLDDEFVEVYKDSYEKARGGRPAKDWFPLDVKSLPFHHEVGPNIMLATRLGMDLFTPLRSVMADLKDGQVVPMKHILNGVDYHTGDKGLSPQERKRYAGKIGSVFKGIDVLALDGVELRPTHDDHGQKVYRVSKPVN